MSIDNQGAQQWLDAHHADGISLGVAELLQYQRLSHRLNLAPGRLARAKLAGNYLAGTKGRGMEFDESRHYHPGDDIRAIDWRVTARTGKTHTKIYQEEKERPVFVIADLSASMYFGTQLLLKSVQAGHLAALIAWSAAKRGDRIGGLVFNDHKHLEYRPRSRHGAVLNLIHGLCELHQPPGANTDNGNGGMALEQALQRARRVAHPGSLVVIISDFHSVSDQALQNLRLLNRHNEVLACPISDPFEYALPKAKRTTLLQLTDAKQSQAVLLGDTEQARDYQQRQQSWFRQCFNNLRMAGCRILPFQSHQGLEEQLAPQLTPAEAHP